MSNLESTINYIMLLCGIVSIVPDILVLSIINEIYMNFNGSILIAFIISNSFMLLLTEIIKYTNRCSIENNEEIIIKANSIKKDAFFISLLSCIVSCIVYIRCGKLSLIQTIILPIFKTLFNYIYYLDIITQSKNETDEEYTSINDNNNIIVV